jgi:hypothetical protein
MTKPKGITYVDHNNAKTWTACSWLPLNWLKEYTPDHLFLDRRAPNLRPLISRLEMNKFKNCWYKSVRFLEVLKLLFLRFLNLSNSQRDMSGPRLGTMSKNRRSGGTVLYHRHIFQAQGKDMLFICDVFYRIRQTPLCNISISSDTDEWRHVRDNRE